MKQHQTITSLPPSPEAERRARMIKYTIAMLIRVVCIFAMLFAQGWWLVIFAAGAILLPYVAVVLANVNTSSRDTQVLRPGGIVPVPAPPSPSGASGDGAPGDAAPGGASDDAGRHDDERGAA
ncbi:DUF3099 domain-containing protein [Agromyces bauzanensis]|uniref:DUF3099 domain-containing protein n=1 Tax=Agromyces bauzanensis TaxID=1308924 RepID=A0A917UQN2_9MICO|nr:DUF3099 domain-containing protein [Agromyces bauzanensis]GGJ76867.1 hypothetical protein GCM10011372_13940 [Agromyces bauzanensis]